MLQFSHDPDAGTIYTYFTELEEGQAAYTVEYPAFLLLDGAGRIIGLRLDLDDEITLDQLELVLEDDPTRLDGMTGRLMVLIGEDGPADQVRLEETAILDLDGDERVLGIELAVPAELRSSERMERLAPLLIALDETPEGGEGPVVFAPPAEEAEGAIGAEEDVRAPREAPQPGTEGHGDAATGAPELAEPPAPSPQAPSANGEGQPPAAPPPAPAMLKTGFVALVGKPNVGKSTLLNALLGERLAIVSPRPQTTRVPMRGILTRPGEQIVFIDTPGIHKPDHRLGQLMVDLAERTLPGADVICFMVDISQPPSQLDERIAQQVQRARGTKLLLLNKVDLPPRRGESNLEAYRALGRWDAELAISARRRLGLTTLLEEISARLPEGPAHYPDDQLTDRTEQQLAAEFVREKVLYYTEHEVPHAVAVEVDEWEAKEHATVIRMTINVERAGQKGILIGAGGAMLKQIGSAARKDIERILGRPVFLELWVKVRENWRDDLSALGWLGYRAKDWR